MFASGRGGGGGQNVSLLPRYPNNFAPALKKSLTGAGGGGGGGFCLFYLIGLGGGFKTSTQNLKIH